MKYARLGIAIAAAFASLSSASALANTVKIDGSSTVFPITEVLAEDFSRANKGKMKVTVGISGTGGGFKKFCRGELDIADASRPIRKTEMEDCKKVGIQFIEVPVAQDALTVVINPKNTWATTLSVDDLKKMWSPDAQGKVKSWKQVNAAFPDTPLALYGPGADSGTFDYFTEAINGKAKASRGDFTASEDDNVLVQGVQRDVGGLGYFGYAYYYENKDKLTAVAIAPKAGAKGVLPAEETVLNGTYTPLARPLFIYVNVKSLERPEVNAFLDYAMKNFAAAAKETKYVALKPAAYEVGKGRIAGKKLGTVFGGGGDTNVTMDFVLDDKNLKN
ncbi:MAG: PstS family phosphate ABC transporter substrate-binding protein [Rhodocyclaceae bacterium]|nr:PstS family phosphate ABC transporter substrate-binding protein [Rhodocyclaceae bacterium]